MFRLILLAESILLACIHHLFLNILEKVYASLPCRVIEVLDALKLDGGLAPVRTRSARLFFPAHVAVLQLVPQNYDLAIRGHVHQPFRLRHFLLLGTHHLLLRLAHVLLLDLSALAAVDVLNGEVPVGRLLLVVDDHSARVDAVQSYPIRNRALLLQRLGRVPDLRLLGHLNLLQLDVVTRHVGTAVLRAHDLVGVEIHHLLVHIVAGALLLRTGVSYCFESEVLLRHVDRDRGDHGFVTVTRHRHPDRGLRLHIHNLLSHSHIQNRLSCSRKCRIIMHPKLFMRIYPFADVFHLYAVKLLNSNALINLSWTCRGFTTFCYDLSIRLKTLELHILCQNNINI